MISRRVLALTASVAFVLLAAPGSAQERSEADTYRQLKLFGDVFERVRADYVDEVTDEELIEAAIRGMLADLDPHSSYMTQDSFQDMQEQTRGAFGGLGIQVTMEEGYIKVIAPIDETPAARAGIRTGDLITHIDGQSVLGLQLDKAVEMLRGPVDSSVTITVQRSQEEPFDVTLVRAVIKVESVRHRAEGDIGYIRITQFNEQTSPGLERAVADLKAQLGDRLVGYVLDLRSNPGGLLSEAIAVSDAFLEQGEIVSTRGRRPDDMQRYNAKPGELVDGKPVVVLINDGSASASEIVAGALQDHQRAILMGTRTFGKGSVQTIVPLPGHGAMRLTTSRYFTPSGRSIQAKGIEPDILVPQARVEVIETGPLRHEEDLRGSLSNPDQPARGTQQQGEDQGTLPQTEPPPGPSTDEPTVDSAGQEVPDYQLERALDLLRGYALFNARAQAQ